MYREKAIDIGAYHFDEAFAIYEASFPKEERRSRELQIELLENKQYNFDIIVDKEECVGILLWWLIGNYRYIEHFAINPKLRNYGIGKKIISAFIAESDIPVVLEVEKPEDTLTKRRVEFYKRQGFQITNHEYAHPPFITAKPFLELSLMSLPYVFSKDDVNHFIDTTHPVVHYKYYEGVK